MVGTILMITPSVTHRHFDTLREASVRAALIGIRNINIVV